MKSLKNDLKFVDYRRKVLFTGLSETRDLVIAILIIPEHLNLQHGVEQTF